MTWEPDEAHLVLVGWEKDVKAMRLRRTCRNIGEDLAEEFMFFAKACISMRDICDLDVVTYALRSLHSEEQ